MNEKMTYITMVSLEITLTERIIGKQNPGLELVILPAVK